MAYSVVDAMLNVRICYKYCITGIYFQVLRGILSSKSSPSSADFVSIEIITLYITVTAITVICGQGRKQNTKAVLEIIGGDLVG